MLNNLKQIRKQRKLTQKDIAKNLNIDYTTYGRYENGLTEPNIDTLLKLSKILGVSIDYIVNNKPTMLTEQEREMLDLFGQLSNVEQGKAIGYCKNMIDLAREQKEKELKQRIKSSKD